MKFDIADDSEFLGIVNTRLYKSFVKQDWEFNDIENHLINEMKNYSILFWKTDVENKWSVEVKETNKINKNGLTGSIKVTDEELYLINYESITMAAKYEDVKLPEKHMEEYRIKLSNGNYNINIIDLFNIHLNQAVIVYDTTNQSHSQRMTITAMSPVRICHTSKYFYFAIDVFYRHTPARKLFIICFLLFGQLMVFT
jgi:hypothetical protein